MRLIAFYLAVALLSFNIIVASSSTTPPTDDDIDTPLATTHALLSKLNNVLRSVQRGDESSKTLAIAQDLSGCSKKLKPGTKSLKNAVDKCSEAVTEQETLVESSKSEDELEVISPSALPLNSEIATNVKLHSSNNNINSTSQVFISNFDVNNNFEKKRRRDEQVENRIAPGFVSKNSNRSAQNLRNSYPLNFEETRYISSEELRNRLIIHMREAEQKNRNSSSRSLSSSSSSSSSNSFSSIPSQSNVLPILNPSKIGISAVAATKPTVSSNSNLPNSTSSVDELVPLICDTTAFSQKLYKIISVNKEILKQATSNGQTIFEIVLRARCTNQNNDTLLFHLRLLLGGGYYNTILENGDNVLRLANSSGDSRLEELLTKILNKS